MEKSQAEIKYTLQNPPHCEWIPNYQSEFGTRQKIRKRLIYKSI